MSAEARPCDHPSGNVHYEHEVAEDGREYEYHWCDVCNCYLTPAAEQELRERQDYDDVLTD